MTVPVISEMVRMFNEDAQPYTPAYPGLDLERETGDPDVSIRNLARLLEGDMFVNHIILRPCRKVISCEDKPCDELECRTLVLFNTGAAYLALGFSMANATKRDALARFASSIGYGDYTRLKKFYDAVGASIPDFDGVLPPVIPEGPRLHAPE